MRNRFLALQDALETAKGVTDRPSFICLHTIIGWPAPHLQGTGKAHEEVELSWEILDPILDYWASLPNQPELYEPGSWGPLGAEAMLARDGFTWRRP